MTTVSVHTARPPSASLWFICATAYVLVMFTTVTAAVTVAVGHEEQMETELWVVAFALLVPSALLLARRQLARIGASASEPLAFLNACVCALLILAGKFAWLAVGERTGSVVLVLGGIAICVANLGVVLKQVPVDRCSSRCRAALEIAAGLLAAAAAFSFFPSTFFTSPRIGAWLLVVAGLSVVCLGRTMIRPARKPSRAVDVVVVLLTALMVTDIRRYGERFRYDYDFFLGPANAVAHGHAMLVDTFSQYGVGMPVLLAGVFEVIPLTYGGLQAVICIAYVIEFTVIYCILRVACRSQLVAVAGLAVAMVANLVLPGFPRMATPSSMSF